MASAQPPIGGRSRGRSRGRAQIPDRLPRVALASCCPWRRLLELPLAAPCGAESVADKCEDPKHSTANGTDTPKQFIPHTIWMDPSSCSTPEFGQWPRSSAECAILNCGDV